MKTIQLATIPFLAATLAVAAPEPDSTTYQVQQTVTLSDIPEGAKNVKWWIAIPDDTRFQEVLDFDVVSVPGNWEVARELDPGRFFHRMLPWGNDRLLLIGGANMSIGKFDDIEVVEVK